MVVATESSSFSFVATGAATPVSIPFQFRAAADLAVFANGVAQVAGTNFTISGVYPAAVITPLAPYWSSGVTITVARDTPKLQETNIIAGLPLPAENIEAELDRTRLIQQEMADDIEALDAVAVQVAAGETPPELDLTGLTDGDLLEYYDGKLRRKNMSAAAGLFAAFSSAGLLVGTAGAMPNVPAFAEYIATADGMTVEDHMTAIVPNGATSAAIQEAVNLANATISVGRWVVLDSRKRYFMTTPVVFGTADAASNIAGIDCQHARLDIRFSGGPVFDFTGIRNGKFQCLNVFINDQAVTWRPECIFAFARPKQASGVKSSGNAIIRGCVIFANCSVGIYRGVSSEVNHIPEDNIFYNYHPIGINAASTKGDYFQNTCALAWDNMSGTAFVPGEVLTGAGGATAKILHLVQDFGGGAGGALVHVTAGAFTDNMTITGSIGGGTATVNEPNGVYVNGPVSTAFPLGVETETTAARAIFNFVGNAASTRAVCPPIFISDFTDVEVSRANLNVNNGNLALVHVQQDATRFGTAAAQSQPPVGFKSQGNYFHSDHKYSVTYGDPATAGSAEVENIILGPECNAGSPTAMTARYAHVGKAGQRMRGLRVVSDHDVDFRNCELRFHNTCELTDPSYSGLELNTAAAMMVTAPSACGPRILLTMADTANNVSTWWTDLNVRNLPPMNAVRTIAAGKITMQRPVFRVDTEDAAASDDLDAIDLPAGVPACGIELTFRSSANARVVTVKVAAGAGARILGPADVVLNNINRTITLIGESGAGNTAVFRVKSVV